MPFRTVETSHVPAVLPIKPAAEYLSVSPSTVWRLLRDKQLKATPIRGRTMIRRIDLDAFLERAAKGAA